MAIIYFEKEDDKQRYLVWRTQNSEGFILNINTWNPNSTSMKNIIHRASGCSSLDFPPSPNRDRPVTPEHPKLCSTDMQDLENEMKGKNLTFKLCGLCMK